MTKLIARLRKLLATRNARALLYAVGVFIATVTITINVATNGNGGHNVTVHVGKQPVVHVDNADPNAKPDNPVVLTRPAVAVAHDLAAGATNGTNDLAAKEAPGLPPLAGTVTGPVAQLQPPFASDSVPGCRTRFLPTNWSARAPGVTPTTFDLHYTAGPDLPHSRADVDGLTAFGSHASARVSWHLNMDKDGNCDYNVPYRYKAWTIAGLNSASINMEVAGTGTAPYLRAGGFRELARIFIDMHHAYPAIKLRLASYRDCTVTRSGIGTHWMGGPCSGGHVDINPLSIVKVIATLRRYVAAISCDRACRLARETAKVRAIHQRTHQRLVKNQCRPGEGGYCQVLRARNAHVHRLARRDRISLTGTYR